MKLKQHPEDFQVEEVTNVTATEGAFAFYRLEKRGWTTPDALQAIRRRWNIELRRLSYGGLKDRHALTIQYLTIFHGPQRHLTHHGITLQYVGQVKAPYTSADISANRFRITLRALKETELVFARQALEEVRRCGVPNYFDDQRFGSVSGSSEFMAHAMVQERYEDALRLALTTPYEHDRGPQKQEKAILLANWGRWPECKAKLPRGHARSLVDYLTTHPTDYRGALARLRPELRGLYLSAYQSHLWNRILARWLQENCRVEQLLSVRLRLGPFPMHRNLDEVQMAQLAALQLSLPSARSVPEASDPRTAVIEAVLAEDGLRPEQMKLKGMREMFFSKGERRALCEPAELRFQEDADEVHTGRRKLLLSFELPRGCYATLIVKRITQQESRPPRW